MKKKQETRKSKKKNSITLRAGVVAYRQNSRSEVEILLITARSVRNSWIFPVGKVKSGETLRQAAARECAEESGYVVEVGPVLKVNRDKMGRKGRRSTFFAAQIIGETNDYETDRQRQWVSPKELMHTVSEMFLPVAKAALTITPFSPDWPIKLAPSQN